MLKKPVRKKSNQNVTKKKKIKNTKLAKVTAETRDIDSMLSRSQLRLNDKKIFKRKEEQSCMFMVP